MKSRKTMGEVIKAVLLVLAIACLYVGVQQFSRIRPAASYEDMGVHRFSPYRALPTQVKNTATGRQGRLHPTKTVWLVYYKATDGILYEWKKSVSSRTEAESIVSGGEIVERRVLSIKNTSKYITIDSKLTARNYVAKQRGIYGMMIGISIVDLIGCVVVKVVTWKQKSRGKGERDAGRTV